MDNDTRERLNQYVVGLVSSIADEIVNDWMEDREQVEMDCTETYRDIGPFPTLDDFKDAVRAKADAIAEELYRAYETEMDRAHPTNEDIEKWHGPE